jgi:hypothetical protein
MKGEKTKDSITFNKKFRHYSIIVYFTWSAILLINELILSSIYFIRICLIISIVIFWGVIITYAFYMFYKIRKK